MAFRTQKISQMTPKGSDLEATDLIEVSTIESGSYVTRSITGQELIDAIPAPSVDWGDIGGTLSDQTDLNTALSGKVPTTRTITINGTTQDLSADRTFTISTGITIGATAITSGTVGRVLFEGTGNVVQESANLFWDNTNGTLEATTTADNLFGLRLKSTTGQLRIKPYLNSTYGVLLESKTANGSANLPLSLSGTRLLLLDGNVLINTTTDAGFKLDVNGTARVQGNTTITSADVANPDVGPPAFNIFNGTFSKFNVVYDAAGCRVNMLGTSTQGLRINTGSSTNFSTIGGGGLTFSCSTNNFQIISASVLFNVAGSEKARFAPSTGNLLINTTTDAGFRLDVNGTARVTSIMAGTQTSISSGVKVESDTNIRAWNQLQLGQFAPTTLTTSRLQYTAGGADGYLISNSMSHAATAGTYYAVRFQNNIAPASGTAVFNLLDITSTINQTGGANGITRGLYVNPTLTAAADFRAIETTAGRVIFGGLPTSSAGLPTGAIWNDAGTLKIV